MKKLFFLILSLGSLVASAQENEKLQVQEAIEAFFDGFHAQDSLKMLQVMAPELVMQRIGPDKQGQTVLRTDDVHLFLKNIVSIPKARNFQEKIKSYSIQIDGPMANAWTAYEFWIDGAMSHCGVNSFQLMNDGSGWKIIYLVDTHRKEDCQ
ncbi:MAG: nuclear transport factor 2 family protein [Flavobacteriaceae bacterium]